MITDLLIPDYAKTNIDPHSFLSLFPFGDVLGL